MLIYQERRGGGRKKPVKVIDGKNGGYRLKMIMWVSLQSS